MMLLIFNLSLTPQYDFMDSGRSLHMLGNSFLIVVINIISSVISEFWLLLVSAFGVAWVVFCYTTSALCHLPGPWFTVNWCWNVFSFKVHKRELFILLRSLLFRMPNKGLLSVTMVKFLHPKINNFALPNAHVTAKSSPSVGEYWVLADDVNRDPRSCRY